MAEENITEKSKEKKKEPTTRPLIIPTEYLLKLIAADRSTKYPVYLCYVNSDTTASWKIRSSEELLSVINSDFIYNSSLVRYSESSKQLHIDVSGEGKVHVKNTVFPDIRPNSRLTWTQAQDYYDYVLKKTY